MHKDLYTRFDIGQEVYAVVRGTMLSSYTFSDKDFSTEHRYGIHKLKVRLIRFIKSKDIEKVQYFLEGIESYEGENWIDEEPDYTQPAYMEPAIFETMKEAQDYLAEMDYELDEDDLDADKEEDSSIDDC